MMFDDLLSLLRIERLWFIIFLFLVGKLHMIHCYIIHKTLMPSRYLALFFFWKWMRSSAVCWMAVLGDLAGVGPWGWGCPAGVLAARPWCHFYQNTNMSFIRKLKHLTIIKTNMLIKVHPDFIINCGWYLYYFSYIYIFINLMFILFLMYYVKCVFFVYL